MKPTAPPPATSMTAHQHGRVWITWTGEKGIDPDDYLIVKQDVVRAQDQWSHLVRMTAEHPVLGEAMVQMRFSDKEIQSSLGFQSVVSQEGHRHFKDIYRKIARDKGFMP